MKPFNVGVLGIGDISDVYISNLTTYDIVSVVGCAGRDLEKARRKAEAHGLPKAYATAAELISDPDTDIVLNLTLPAAHAQLTTMALEAGKHVYTEKPLASTLRGRRKNPCSRQGAWPVGLLRPRHVSRRSPPDMPQAHRRRVDWRCYRGERVCRQPRP